MPDIFISYVEEDINIVQEIAQGLEAVGYTTWYYTRDSLPGSSYLERVNEMIERSQAIVLVISEHSLASRNVDAEVVRAHEGRKHFIPVLYGLTHGVFQEWKPEWRMAVGAAVSIAIPSGGVAVILPRLREGLRALGIQPLRVPSHPPPSSAAEHGRRKALCMLDWHKRIRRGCLPADPVSRGER